MAKAIINGKRYDTETAHRVAGWDNGHFTSDFHYCHEVIWRTTSGAWFLEGSGGALSSYAESVGDGTCGGDAIVPMTDDEVSEWLERHHKIDALEQHFASAIVNA